MKQVSVLVSALAVVSMASCGDDDGGASASAPSSAVGTWSVGGDATAADRWPGDDANDQPVPVDPETANLTDIKNELKEYHDSGRYEQDLEEMAERAEACMLEAAEGVDQPALVLDIDETALTNYDWMVSVDFLRDSPLLSDLFAEHASGSDIPPIEPVLELYRVARDNDIDVFFISGRRERLQAPTDANLRNAGYTDYTQAYYAPNDYSDASIVPFKSGAREDIAEQGYTIVANVGDQNSDLEGGFGQCPHKLADPYYFIP